MSSFLSFVTLFAILNACEQKGNQTSIDPVAPSGQISLDLGMVKSELISFNPADIHYIRRIDRLTLTPYPDFQSTSLNISCSECLERLDSGKNAQLPVFQDKIPLDDPENYTILVLFSERRIFNDLDIHPFHSDTLNSEVSSLAFGESKPGSEKNYRLLPPLVIDGQAYSIVEYEPFVYDPRLRQLMVYRQIEIELVRIGKSTSQASLPNDPYKLLPEVLRIKQGPDNTTESAEDPKDPTNTNRVPEILVVLPVKLQPLETTVCSYFTMKAHHCRSLSIPAGLTSIPDQRAAIGQAIGDERLDYLLVIGTIDEIKSVYAENYSSSPPRDRLLLIDQPEQTQVFDSKIKVVRLPIETVSQGKTFFDRLTGHLTKPAQADESYHALLVSAFVDEDGDGRDDLGDFTTVERTKSLLESKFAEISTAYYAIPLTEPRFFFDGSPLPDNLLRGLNADQNLIARTIDAGVDLILFYGNGDDDGWKSPRFKTNDFNILNNQSSDSIIVSFDDGSGSFDRPNQNTANKSSFITAALSSEKGGARAIIAPVVKSEKRLKDLFWSPLVKEIIKPDTTMASALKSAKIQLLHQIALSGPDRLAPFDAFQLFGDPTAILLPSIKKLLVVSIDYDNEKQNLTVSTGNPETLVMVKNEVGLIGGGKNSLGRIAIDLSQEQATRPLTIHCFLPGQPPFLSEVVPFVLSLNDLGFTAQALNDETILIDWNRQTGEGIRYRIYLAPKGASEIPLLTTVDGPPFTATALRPSTNYQMDLVIEVEQREMTRSTLEITTRDPIETSFEVLPDTISRDGRLNIVLSSNYPEAVFECSLDGTPYYSCKRNETFLSLSEGIHTIYLRASDSLAKVDPTPLFHRFSVERTPPETSFEVFPETVSRDGLLNLVPTSNDRDATFECSIDGSVFLSCDQEDPFLGLSDGIHLLQIRAIDSFGKTDPTPLIHRFTVDRIPPKVVFTPPPGNHFQTSELSYSYSQSEEIFSTTCSLDGQTLSSCLSPIVISDLSEGEHRFAIQFSDAAGNLSGFEHLSTVDLSRPVTRFADPLPARINRLDISIDFFSSEPAGFRCSFDDGPFVPCTSPFERSSVKPGDHRFRVVSRDLSGNEELVPLEYRFTVDLSVPTIEIDNPPAAQVYDATSITIEFSANEAGSFSCRIDQDGTTGTMSLCTSPVTFQVTVGLNYVFSVEGIDLAGNRTIQPVSTAFTVLPSPIVWFDTVPPEPITTSSVEFSFNGNSTTFFSCRLDLGSITIPCLSPYRLTGLSEGGHTLTITGYDQVNTPSAPVIHPFVVEFPDTTPPNSPNIVIAKGNATTATSDVTVDISAKDDKGLDGYCLLKVKVKPLPNDDCFVEIASTRNHSLSISYTLTDGDGYKTVYLWYRDSSGNISVSAEDSIVFDPPDLLAPLITSMAIDKGDRNSYDLPVDIELAATDDRGIIGYCLKDDPLLPTPQHVCWTSVQKATAFSTKKTFSLSDGPGEKIVYAWVRDGGGNLSVMKEASIVLKNPDSIAPGKPYLDPAFSSYSPQRLILIPIDATDDNGIYGYCITYASSVTAASGCWQQTPETTYFSAAIPFQLQSHEGRHLLHIFVRDKSNNQSPGTDLSLDYWPLSPRPNSFFAIEAGSLVMGSKSNTTIEAPEHLVFLRPYLITKYETTNSEYRGCIEAGFCSDPELLHRFDEPGYEYHPVSGVTYQQAADYCSYLGGNLPSEARWEFAARGFESRIFPWGYDLPDFDDFANCAGNICIHEKFEQTAPVGSFPAGVSPFGIFDLAGNVAEWTEDFADCTSDLSPGCADGSPFFSSSVHAIDPLNRTTAPARIVKGGSYNSTDPENDDQASLRSSARQAVDAGESSDDLGFRCVSDQGMQGETSPPSDQLVLINQDDPLTRFRQVEIGFSATDDTGIVAACFLENELPPEPDDDCWIYFPLNTILYATTFYELSGGYGQKTVFAWFRDIYDNISTAVFDTIAYSLTNVFVPIAAGPFIQGSNSANDDEGPARQVTLSAFEILAYPVSAGEYADCVDNLDCSDDIICEYDLSNFRLIGWENHPMNCVSFDQARNYCQAIGGDLPSEAEWERTAKGGLGSTYPWGPAWDLDQQTFPRLNLCDYNCPQPNKNEALNDGYPGTSPVGWYEYGKTTEAIYDLQGNVSEWVRDYYNPAYYSIGPSLNPLNDTSALKRVIRGGNYLETSEDFFRNSRRIPVDPTTAIPSLGFRCVRP